MTLGRYGRIDDTDNLGLLRRWYNPFPVSWFSTKKFFEQYREVFGQGKDKSISKDVYRQLSYNKIIALDVMIKGVSLLMRNTNDRNMFAILNGRKAENHTGNLSYYIDEIKKYVSIEVKDFKDLERLQKKIEFLLDKYNERYNPKKKETVKKTKPEGFIYDVMGIFIYMDVDYDSKMTLFEFENLKKKADKKSEPNR